MNRLIILQPNREDISICLSKYKPFMLTEDKDMGLFDMDDVILACEEHGVELTDEEKECHYFLVDIDQDITC